LFTSRIITRFTILLEMSSVNMLSHARTAALLLCVGYLASVQQVQADDKTLWCATDADCGIDENDGGAKCKGGWCCAPSAANDTACTACFPKGQCRVCQKGHTEPTEENGFKCEKIPGWEDPDKPKKKKRRSKKSKKSKGGFGSMIADAGVNIVLAACVLGAGYLAFIKLTAKGGKKSGGKASLRSKAKSASKRK